MSPVKNILKRAENKIYNSEIILLYYDHDVELMMNWIHDDDDDGLPRITPERWMVKKRKNKSSVHYFGYCDHITYLEIDK